MSELNNALADYLAAVIATKQREEQARAIKGLSEEDHAMIRRGFARAKEIERDMIEMRQRNPVVYNEENRDKILQSRQRTKVQGNKPTKPGSAQAGRDAYVPTAAALAAAEIFSRIYTDR